jgi:hypothetical protein
VNAARSNYYRQDAPFTARVAWRRAACTNTHAVQPGMTFA